MTEDVGDAPAATAAWCAAVGAAATDATLSRKATAGLNWLLIALKRGTETVPGLLTAALGPYLTHSDPAVRARAIDLLGTVLDRLPGMKLAPKVNSRGSNCAFLLRLHVQHGS